MKKNIILIFLVSFILLLLSYILFFLNKYDFYKLSSYNIISVYEEKDKLLVDFTKSKNAIKYVAKVYDEKDNLIYENSSKKNIVDISKVRINYNDKIIIRSYVQNKKKKVLDALNEIEYTNNQASFSMIENHFVDSNKDINLYLIGYDENNYYSLDIISDKKVIYNIDDVKNYVTIYYKDIESFTGKLTARLKNKNNRIISEFNFYLDAPEVKDIKIISPNNNYETIWDDVSIKVDGGENANTLRLYVYDKRDKIVFSKVMPYDSSEIIIPASYFKENKNYRVKVFASYNDYIEIAKSNEININVLEKVSASPVYINKNNTFIKSGEKIKLLSQTKNADIYYTIDGSKPTENSMKYKDEITINKDMIIKTFAKRKNMYDSDVNTYDFTVKDKELVVYLSPSNQYLNKGVSSVGYSNERDMMNKLTDKLEKNLKNAGVIVYRNKPSGNINLWLAESNNKKSDLHLAIHSNGSELHDTKGMEIYVDKSTSKCLSIATNIYNNLYSIYPFQDSKTNRGVKYASGSLGEANDNFIKCGTLIEVAYHDDKDDAKWIVDHMDDIANNISNSILSFYGK